MTRNIHAHIALRFCQCASWWALASCGSQGSQDAIIASIFSKIGETNRFFVEFGFNGAGTIRVDESWRARRAVSVTLGESYFGIPSSQANLRVASSMDQHSVLLWPDSSG